MNFTKNVFPKYKITTITFEDTDMALTEWTSDIVTVKITDIFVKLQQFSTFTSQNGGLTNCWLGPHLYYIITEPVKTEAVLKNNLEKDETIRFLRALVGNASIFAPVPIWKPRRKVSVPAFSPKIISNFVKIFIVQSEKLVTKLAQRAGTGDFEIWPFLNAYSLDAILESAMGVQIDVQDNCNNEILTAVNTKRVRTLLDRLNNMHLKIGFTIEEEKDGTLPFLDVLVKRKSSGSLVHTLFRKPTHTNQYLKAVSHHLSSHLSSVPRTLRVRIETLRASVGEQWLQLATELSTGKHDHQTAASTCGAGPGISTITERGKIRDTGSETTFLDLLISMSGGDSGYTEVELREEVLTFLLAATDTSAVAMGFVLKLVGKYPDVQEKIYRELQDVFGDMERPLEKGDLPKLQYLERVIKETLRLYPSVPFIIRKADTDTVIPGDTLIPEGSGILISIWGIHRNQNIWGSDADCFDPDRFLPERLSGLHPCAYIPFSYGPRNCLGYQYAMMSIKTTLCTILRRYKVISIPEPTPIPNMRVKFDIMLKAVDEFVVALESR
ncbi:cytochrome P450 4C1-like [Leptidea sinapis]|uniref:cytochrome P450 4C1-like n=1 Tax=Leptidea sinapis TaxID=189913 RepID=UPI0021C359D4|nr:cytochrome P450 4C1-like [Leptidea sinapis]